MNDVAPALELSQLRVQLTNGDAIVDGVDLQLASGEIVGLVGESGAGKTTTALSLLGYTAAGTEIGSINLAIGGEPMHEPGAVRQARGRLISYVPQNPATALNPSLRIADAINHMILTHRKRHADRDAVEGLLGTVGLPASGGFARRFPHQLSGGQQQRVCIAVSLAGGPTVVVLDEPTTGLDVVTQARILDELLRLRDEQRVAMLYVTHDLAVVAQIADRIAVMYAGTIVEEGRSHEVLRHPRHPYTRGLLDSIPDHVRPRAVRAMAGIAVGVGEHPAGCPFAPRCPQRVAACEAAMPPLEEIHAKHRVRCFEWARTLALERVELELVDQAPDATAVPALDVEHLRAEHRMRGETVVAVNDVSFSVHRGACVGLVGESGSGKTTIARAIAGLHQPTAGRISLCGRPLAGTARERRIDERRQVQIIFQNPTDALNPRHTVRATIDRPARVLRNLGKKETEAEVTRLLELVRLPARVANRYPAELSGGEQQRVAIARALVAEPELIVCDEVTSALDVSVQAAVLALLDEFRRELGLSLVFITHDLGVVASVADYLLVLEGGVVREEGPTGRVLREPSHGYTQRLLASAPSLSTALEAAAGVESEA